MKSARSKNAKFTREKKNIERIEETKTAVFYVIGEKIRVEKLPSIFKEIKMYYFQMLTVNSDVRHREEEDPPPLLFWVHC